MNSQFLTAAALEVGVEVVKIEPSVAEALRRVIEDRYAKNSSGPLWERMANKVSIRSADGWILATQFTDNVETVIFFDREQPFWLFRSGTDLRAVLWECPGMEFYTTDLKGSFVLCHNQHDFLIGAGSCQSWLETFIARAES